MVKLKLPPNYKEGYFLKSVANKLKGYYGPQNKRMMMKLSILPIILFSPFIYAIICLSSEAIWFNSISVILFLFVGVFYTLYCIFTCHKNLEIKYNRKNIYFISGVEQKIIFTYSDNRFIHKCKKIKKETLKFAKILEVISKKDVEVNVE